MIASTNPATGEVLQRFEPLTESALAAKVERAQSGFLVNRGRPFEERSALMQRVASLLIERKRDYGRTITLEMGKPIAAAIAEVEKCSRACSFYAERAAGFLANEPVQTEATETYIRYEPLGIVLAVMPWNFPFWQVFRFVAPALMAGNAGLLKHSSNVPQCALAIEQVVVDAGFSAGEFQTLLIGSGQVKALLEDERVKAATLTGSEPAGASVASAAANRIKKSVLELGGSDPFIVMPSADLEQAVKVAVQARTVNNGQSCIAAKRFVVHHSIASDFEARFVDAMRALRIGDPMDEATEIGPLAMPQLVDDIDRQVQESVAGGATLLTGGRRIDGKGNYYPPTVLSGVTEAMPAWREETFGPVAALIVARDTSEAIRIANATEFGLGSSVWTNDRAEADAFISGIEAGQVFVNAMVASDPRVPFGGVKHSGFGRELGVHGIREFVNVKTVWIASMGDAQSRSVE